jgi:hypothetical protein
MISPRTKLGIAAVMMIAIAVPAFAQTKSKDSKLKARQEEAAGQPEVIWRDPGDPATLDLFYGAGGKDQAPDPAGPYTFVAEDLKQTSPKFDVDDAHGVRWRVKLGSESRSETAATRLVWAAGYFVDEDYYLSELKVQGLPKLKRGQKYVTEDGVVHGARLERKFKSIKQLGKWKWSDCPFEDTRELNGLRVMMALVNNWDLITKNNSIYETEGEQRYLVSDLGATFGRTGNFVSGSKDKPQDYEKSKFIEKVTPDTVDFVMHGQPFFITLAEFHRFVSGFVKRIPRTDAKWIGERLAQLSESQIRDCFRAAGYSLEEIDGLTKTVQERIAELNDL